MAFIPQRLSAKVVVIVIATGAFAGTAAGCIADYSARSQATTILKRDAMMVAAMVASRIDPRVFDSIRSEADRGHEGYLEITEKLDQAKEEFKSETRPFIVRNVEDKIEYVVGTNESTKVGERAEIRPGMRTALDVGENATSNLYEDRRGSWIAGYAPIKDREGNVVAAVGVETSAREIGGDTLLTALRSGIVGGLGGLLMAVAGFLLMSRVSSLIDQSSATVSSLLDGRFSASPIDVTGSDEVAHLARLLNALASKGNSGATATAVTATNKRETGQLKAEVEQLRSALALAHNRLEGFERSSRGAVARPPQRTAEEQKPVEKKRESVGQSVPSTPSSPSSAPPPSRLAVNAQESAEQPKEPVRMPASEPETPRVLQPLPDADSPIRPSEVPAAPDISEASREANVKEAGGEADEVPELKAETKPELLHEPMLIPAAAKADPILDLSSQAGSDEPYLIDAAPAAPPMPAVYLEGIDMGADLRKVVEDALLNMDSEAAMRGLIFQVDIDDRVPPVPFEEELLESALRELFAKAALAGETGSEGVIACTKAGKQCEISVRVSRAAECAGEIDLARLTGLSEELEGMCWVEEEADGHVLLRLEFPLVAAPLPPMPVPQGGIADGSMDKKSLSEQGLLS